jgi:hypothetical protein
MVKACVPYGTTCRSPCGYLHDWLHKATGAIHTPHIHIVDRLEMVHVANHYRINVGHGKFCVLQRPFNCNADKFLTIAVRVPGFMMGLSYTDYSHESFHCPKSLQ